MASVVLAGLALTPAAHADVYGNTGVQHTSLFMYVPGPCAAEDATTAQDPYSYLPPTFESGASVAWGNGGGWSFNASLKGFLGLTYTLPTAQCANSFNIGPYGLAVHADLYKWNGSQWYTCETNEGIAEGPYGLFWSTTPAVTWGFKVTLVGNCGAGWYYSDGMASVMENGAWRYWPYAINAGNSGPIWEGNWE